MTSHGASLVGTGSFLEMTPFTSDALQEGHYWSVLT